MSKKVVKYDYNSRKSFPLDHPKKTRWWKFDTTCDKCGKTFFVGELSMKEPDMNEADFCIDCLRELMDKKIPYSTAKMMYQKNE